MDRRRRVQRSVAWVVLALSAMITTAPAQTRAACTQAQELEAFRASFLSSLRCARRQIQYGPAVSCDRPPAPPPCAAAALSAALALLVADLADPPAAVGTGSQLVCQKAIIRAGTRFLSTRLTERLAGKRRQLASKTVFRSLVRRCAVTVAQDPSGRKLPAVGGPCAEAIPPPGNAVASQRLADCLRPALEGIANSVAPEPLPPNIILVLTDDQRWDTLGYMPQVMEQLVARGIEFTNGFVTTPLCCPSRSSIFTGEYAHNTGVVSNYGAPVFDDSSTIATWLHDAGYRTALMGKYMNAYDLIAPYVPPGWDTWRAFVENAPLYYGYTLSEDGVLRQYGSSDADYSTDVLRDMALAFIGANADQPFFLVLAPAAPHSPFTPAARHIGAYADVPPWRPPSWNEPDVSDKPAWVRFWSLPQNQAPDRDEKNDKLRRDQLETLLAVDEGVGAILAKINALGLADNTVVLFTSDNGFLWREHWLSGKDAGYEESIRVPFAVRYPALVPMPRSVGDLVLNIDLAPTFADLAGIPVPPAVDGRSLLGLLSGATPWRQDFLIEYWKVFPIVPTWAGVRTAQWKYIRIDPPVFFQELYDLSVDPYELQNLASNPAYASVLAALSARLDALRVE